MSIHFAVPARHGVAYTMHVRFSWNDAKAATNLARHGVAFGAIEHFDWSMAVVTADVRRNYGEVRLVATAPIKGRLHVLIYTVETRSVRVISLRKASNKEKERYAAEV